MIAKSGIIAVACTNTTQPSLSFYEFNLTEKASFDLEYQNVTYNLALNPGKKTN